MIFTEIIEESFIVLKSNRLRTALSALGIIIGIGSVIALMSIGEASQKSITDKIQTLGSNLLTITPYGTDDSLKNADLVAIQESARFTTISKAAGEYSSRESVSYSGITMENSINIYSVTQDYFDVKNVVVETGSEFSNEDFENGDMVAIVGPDIVSELFGNQSAIGSYIKVDNKSFKIIGVTEEKGSFGRMSLDELVYIPYLAGKLSLFGNDYFSSIYVTSSNDTNVDEAQNQLGFFLLEQHRITNSEDADFSISNQESLLETIEEVTGTFTTMLAGIAAISLVVGGIGIMNIMLVTVTERTREIGLRKALGAKRKTIIQQFLVESVLLTVLGGLIGVVLGVSGALVISKLMGLPPTISYSSIFLAVIVSTLIGLIFGLYPAQKASKLQPIEALRYE